MMNGVMEMRQSPREKQVASHIASAPTSGKGPVGTCGAPADISGAPVGKLERAQVRLYPHVICHGWPNPIGWTRHTRVRAKATSGSNPVLRVLYTLPYFLFSAPHLRNLPPRKVVLYVVTTDLMPASQSPPPLPDAAIDPLEAPPHCLRAHWHGRWLGGMAAVLIKTRPLRRPSSRKFTASQIPQCCCCWARRPPAYGSSPFEFPNLLTSTRSEHEHARQLLVSPTRVSSHVLGPCPSGPSRQSYQPRRYYRSNLWTPVLPWRTYEYSMSK